METSQTKGKIGNVFIDLCAVRGFSKVSVQEVSKQAQINRQTFYYHFTDKKDLLRWVYYQDSLRYINEEALHMENWEEQALKMLRAMKQKRFFYRNMLDEAREILINEFFYIVKQHFTILFHQVDEEQTLSPEDVQFYSRFFSYGCCGILENWILTDYTEPPIEIAGQLFQLAKDVELFSYRLYQTEEE